MDTDYVFLMRLDAANGFYDMADAIKVANAFQAKGIDAIAELSVGEPGDGMTVFHIKVPADQVDEAKSLDIEI